MKTHSEIKKVKEEIEMELLKRKGITAVDISRKGNQGQKNR